MRINRIESYQVSLPLLSPFKTSYGQMTTKELDILVITDDHGNQGYGELVAFSQPDYTEETLVTARLIMKNHLLPLLLNKELGHPSEVSSLLASVRGNYMAKSAVETALWDLYAKQQKISLAELFNVQKTKIRVGISIGIQETISDLLQVVGEYVAQGYTRVKLKIKPGFDYLPVAAVCEKFPDLDLMVDANSAYSLVDLPLLKKLGALDLALIEQPFGYADFLEHSELQKQISTRICLDENIRSLADVKLANQLDSARAINLKIARVGGITEAQKIVDYCQEKEILLWCGGMFESGIGRALNVAFAAQEGFNFPGDISASNRYFLADIIEEEFELVEGQLMVPKGFGLGVTLNQKNLAEYGHYQLIYEKN